MENKSTFKTINHSSIHAKELTASPTQKVLDRLLLPGQSFISLCFHIGMTQACAYVSVVLGVHNPDH